MISIDQWRESGDLFTYQGHKIFYRLARNTNGNESAPTLVLIHGFPTASWDWQKLWPKLNERFHLITLDMLGFGFSDKPTSVLYSIGMQADIFTALLAKLNISDFHLLAHDYGDTVAQELLARDQERDVQSIKSLLLLNGGLFPETHRALLAQKILISPLGGLLVKLMSKRSFLANFNHICAKPLSKEELEGFWQLFQFNQGSKVMPKLIRYMEERKINRERWAEALIRAHQDSHKIPVRLINGVDDPISGLHMVDRYCELIPTGDVVKLNNVGHYPQVEAAEEVWSALDDFFIKNGC